MKRRILLGIFSALVLSGCNQEKDNKITLNPVKFDKHDRCHLCGMVIAHYEGPKAEIFIKNVEEPIKFCSVRDAFTFALQPENKRRLQAFFVHAMDSASWDKPFDAPLLSAKEMFFVYGSRQDGVMGVEPIPFKTKSAAEDFIKKLGGRVVAYPEIDLNLLASDH